MEQKHTSGPWFAVEYSGYHNLHDSDQYGATNILDEDQCARAPYNAKLAAAAPELLEALQRIIEWSEGEAFEDTPVLANAKEVMAKATE